MPLLHFVHLLVSLEKKLNRLHSRVHKLNCSIPKDVRTANCVCNDFPDLRYRCLKAASRLFMNNAENTCHALHPIKCNEDFLPNDENLISLIT